MLSKLLLNVSQIATCCFDMVGFCALPIQRPTYPLLCLVETSSFAGQVFWREQSFHFFLAQ
jgi:hypothetical protein